jgi:hypothetical protein
MQSSDFLFHDLFYTLLDLLGFSSAIAPAIDSCCHARNDAGEIVHEIVVGLFGKNNP